MILSLEKKKHLRHFWSQKINTFQKPRRKKKTGGRRIEKKERVKGKTGKRKAKEINQEKENKVIKLKLSNDNKSVNS